ncbi:Hypothetical_protein [Hexamita inflata]|uniref:Hypothetical_protein n=1 Tax=Hexamita inflata TaxID=28002 RepID=A0ABP1GFM2_9EUKA
MPQVIILSIDCGAKNSGIAVHYPQSNQTTMVSISGNSPGTKSSSTMYIKLNTQLENLTIQNIFFEGQQKIPHEEDIYSVSDYKQVLVNGGLEVLAKNVQSEEDVPIPITKIMELFFGQVKFLLGQILEDEIYEIYVIFPIFQLTASTKQIIVEAMNTAFDFKEENAVKTNQTPKITLIHEATACCLIDLVQLYIYIYNYIYPTHLTFIYTCMVYVSSAWPSSFRFDFTYFPTGQVGMPVSEHLQCSRLITGLQFSIGVSRIGVG